MKATIISIEDGIAVLELKDGKKIEFPSFYLDGFIENDIIEITFTKDEKATKEKEEEIKQKLFGLFDN